MKVYHAINAVQSELAKAGISKDSTNTFDNYKFRGIDAVYNAVSPLLAKHGLCILPRMLSRTVDERQSQKGGALFYVTMEAEFDFVSAEDGSKHTVKTFGEAMDRGDKATNKAMSAAYKYAVFQSFSIPTEGDNDADATTHEVAVKDGSDPALLQKLEDSIDAAKTRKNEAARTTAMKVKRSIQEHIANSRDWKVLEEWQGLRKLVNGEEIASIIWGGLPTPERETITRLQNEAKALATVSPTGMKETA